jgi:glutamate synthase (NADPH/NADH) small chain
MSDYQLPDGRLEQQLKDKRPAYNEAEAIAEANRCIYCSDAPCVAKCPADIDIPNFIHKISTGNHRGAARTIFEDNLLGYSCARVCPVEVLCVGDCVYNDWGREPIQIGRLQRWATEEGLRMDAELLNKTAKPSSGKKVALIGGGPASLACAGHLALDGHKAVIFEKKDVAGGLNTLGIAPYKFKANDALMEIEFIKSLGDVELRLGVGVSDGAAQGSVSAQSLLEDYDAVFFGVGLGPDTLLDLPGMDGPGVLGATHLIERIKRDPTLDLSHARRAIVVGGGNTAIDIAHELALLGVEDVAMVYRRGEEAMSAYDHEMVWGREDGVRVIDNSVPQEVLRDDDGSVRALRVSPGVDGKAIDGEWIDVGCDFIVFAIGQARLTDLATAFEGVKLDEKGRVQVDEATCRTGNDRVWAGGDCVNGGKEVVNAAQHGKLAARDISAKLAG